MFEPLRVHQRIIGHVWSTANESFFFGTAGATRDELHAHFGKYRFAWLRQVHGRTVVDADPETQAEADAHVTAAARLALGIVTADCVPVLLASRTRVGAVHAGWRGIEADVIGAAMAQFPADDPVARAAIGPHLSYASFEVGRDVAARLVACTPRGTGEVTRTHDDPGKLYVDLTRIARAQIRARAPDAQLIEFTPDTLTSPAYHSFRGAGARAGRNLSFVVRNS